MPDEPKALTTTGDGAAARAAAEAASRPSPAPAPGPTATTRAASRLVALGFLTILMLVVGGGAWAAIAQLASAVIASGVVIVESDNKKVQHQQGGIVAEIDVHDGDRVEAGQLLIRLDDTQIRASRQIVDARLVEYEAQLSRLESERDGLAAIRPTDALAARLAEPQVARALAGERVLFEARRTALSGQRDQLRQRIAQLDQQIIGLAAQQKAKEDEIALIEDELVGLEDLLAKGHVPVTRVIALKRDGARLRGELGAIIAQIATTRSTISETELQIIQLERDSAEEVNRSLRTVQAEIPALAERLIAADDELARTLIRAPRAGMVHELAVHTVGGVTAPGETLLKIVPEEDALVLETRIPTSRIDDVRVGQKATIAFTGLDSRTTPMLAGHVTLVSPDMSTDERTGESFYLARLALQDGEAERLGAARIQPGMPVEVFIATGERSVLDYLVDPLMRTARHALREG